MARIPEIGFISLGCPKALVDTERIVTELRVRGYRVGTSYHNVDLVIVNTCGFIDEAVAESLDAISEALHENGRVIVCGCLGGRQDTDGSNFVKNRCPKVLGVTGPDSVDEVLAMVAAHCPPPHEPWGDLVPKAGIRLTPKHYAYLKISEGCNHHCSFCIIPNMRGKLVSRPIGSVLTEAQHLVEGGVKELVVISQDTGAYGVDSKYSIQFFNGRPMKTRLLDLCRELGQLPAWTRLHYVYPYPHIDEIIPLMAEHKILPYLDVPLQHAHPRILKDMKRPASGEKNLERIAAWRAICPDITIRSTFIAGFPGETEAEFEYLLDFLREAQLDRVGCFAYSPVEGAQANLLPGALPDEVRLERQARVMALQAEITQAKLDRQIGQTMEVMIDEMDDEAGLAIGRTKADAPEVDGKVFVETLQTFTPGDIVKVKVHARDEFDLVGVPENEPPTQP